MTLKMPNLPLTQEDIKQHIPHRDPFLLVDVVTHLEPFKYVEGYRVIPEDLPVFQGHFPGRPIYPGVLVVEGLAQISAILGRYAFETDSVECMLTEISATRFRRPALPGEKLVYKSRLIKRRGTFFWFEGEVVVGDQQVASSSFSAMMR